MEIEIDGSEFTAFASHLAGAPSVLEGEIEIALTRSGILVQNQAKLNLQGAGKIDRGGLINSVTNQVANKEAKIGSNLIYAPVVEKGRTPGAKPPPVAAIAGWLGRKGGDPSMAFVVARAIGRRGIPASPYLEPALTAMTGQIKAEFDAAIRRAIDKIIP